MMADIESEKQSLQVYWSMTKHITSQSPVCNTQVCVISDEEFQC